MLIDELGYDLLGIYPKMADVLRLFKATQPDIVILDIELADGGDGVSLAEQLQQIRPVPIIFATSFEDKSTIDRALKTDPYAYLVKPLEKGALQAAIELALYQFSKTKEDQPIPTYTGWSEDLLINDSFYIKSGEKLVKLSLQDILYVIVTENRYCDIVTSERKFHFRSSLNQIEQKLDPRLFIRVHRTTLVNVSKIESIQEFDLTVTVGGHDVQMGRIYKEALLKQLKMF